MDDGATSASSIGMNVRELRKWRKMSLEGLAGLAGLSKGYLSKIENGHSAVNKRDTLIKIARALRVSVADLVGTAYLTERPDHDAHGAIPDIRVALLSATLDEAAQLPSRPIDELTEQTRQVAEWRQLCRDADVGRALPPLLLDLHATAAGGGDDRPKALRNLVQASHSTTLFLKNFGAVDLAWVAADRGHQAAIALDDPVYVAASEFARAQALIGLGAYERADTLAKHAAELLQTPNSSTEFEVYGTTLLTAAFCSGLLGNDADGPLHEAEAVVGQIAGSGTNAFWFNFNRANVNQWRMNIALEADDPVRAVEIAQQIDIDDIPARSRKSGFLIDQARALYALRGKDDDVIEMLRRAEKLGPTRTRNNIWVREMVSEMWHRSRRDAGGRELRGLADRMGIISAA